MFTVFAEPRIASLKLGRKWGRGGGGDKANWMLCSAKVWARTPGAIPPTPRKPRPLGEGAEARPPDSGTRDVQVQRRFPDFCLQALAALGRAIQEINNSRRRFLTLLYV